MHWIGSQVGSRTNLTYGEKKSTAPTTTELQFLGHPFFSLATKPIELAQLLCTICDNIIFTSLLRKPVYQRRRSTFFSEKLQWKRISKRCQQEHYISSSDGRENEDLLGSWVECYKGFRRTNCLHLQGLRLLQ